MGVSFLGAFAELTLIPEAKRRLDSRRERRHQPSSISPLPSSSEGDGDKTRRISTAVLIAMPRPHPHPRHHEEGLMPEVALGTSVRMVQIESAKNPDDVDGEVARTS